MDKTPMTREDVIEELKNVIWKNHEDRQNLFALQFGLSQSYVNDVYHNRMEPSKKILDALGLERVVTYRRKENK